MSDGDNNGNYRLIEYSIDSSGTDWDDFKLTNTDITENGNYVSHLDNCETCQNNMQVMYDKDYPRLKHEKSKNYPE